VTGRLDTVSGMSVAYLDFPGFGVPVLAGPLEPFVGIGVASVTTISGESLMPSRASALTP
jgi:hypothetical protein